MRSWPRVFAALLCLTAATAASPPAAAQSGSLDAMPFGGEKFTLDGMLKEWRGRMTRLSSVVQGKGIRVDGMVGYDDTHLYVGIDARDKTPSRTEGAGGAEDHATLYLAFPNEKGQFTTRRIALYPGVPGKVGGAVKLDGRELGGATLVEAPHKDGITFEAKLPWSAIPEARRVRVGLRAALRYTDASAPGRVSGIVASSNATSGGGLPALPLEAEQGLATSLLVPKRLGTKPAFSRLANVAGDDRLEMVALYGTFLTIAGPGYRGGKQFYFSDLSALSVPRAELHDFDGDGRSEILVVRRLGNKAKFRDVLEVRRAGTGEVPNVVFSHEIAIVTEDGRVENDLHIEKQGGRVTIRVTQGKATGFEPDTYAEPRVSDMPPTLLPWESVQSRTYAWDGSGFTKVDEKTGTPTGPTKAARPTAPKGPPPPPPPRPPTADELQDRLYALYRKERSVGQKAPRFDFVTDVAGSTEMERVLVHDRDIVVFGKGYRGGTSFAFITVGVSEAKDILDVTARDLTGDGKAEVVVRGVLRAKASKELGGDIVTRHALFVYKASDGGVTRIFAAETGRALGDNRILGTVLFVPSGRGTRIELRPGRAVGWTEASYPFPPDTTAAGGLEPLLLPWSGASPRSYAWNGSQFSGG